MNPEMGKTILDGHFGIQTQMINDYVFANHDVTEPKEVYETLAYRPLRITMVNFIFSMVTPFQLFPMQQNFTWSKVRQTTTWMELKSNVDTKISYLDQNRITFKKYPA
jgi:hypothetical protein